jgi:hypothetical protein
MNTTEVQKKMLFDILKSYRSTNGGEVWPDEYNNFFRVWGFFNRIYDTLYSDNEEWKRIARFALDARFRQVCLKIKQMDEIRDLASRPCVGNGRNDYQPSKYVRISFQTLRTLYQIDIAKVCQETKCQERKNEDWPTCDSYDWPSPPQKVTKPRQVIYTHLGATLTIIYQIRNNLFHGTKQEITEPQYQRNRELIYLSRVIMQNILSETNEVISAMMKT